MSVRIPCFCGQTLTAGAETAGRALRCPACGWEHVVPVMQGQGARDKAGRESWRSWATPILAGTVSICLVLAALLWALLPAGGGGSGAGGTGHGQGALAGDGAGAGKTGDGAGAGTADDGGGTAAVAAPEKPSRPVTAATQRPAAAAPLPATTTRPVKHDDSPIASLQAFETPTAGEPPAGGEPGKQGAAGGGGFGRGEGADPGAKGDVSFTLTWREYTDFQPERGRGGPDIDVWVKDPGGSIINTSRENVGGGVGMGPSPDGGRADIDDQGAYGDGDGGGPERIFWPQGKAPKGAYHYGVRWYKGTGVATYTLRVYRGTKLVTTKSAKLSQDAMGQNKELGVIAVE